MKTKLHPGKLIPLILSFIIFSASIAVANPRPDINFFSAAERQQLNDLILDYICNGQPEYNGLTPNDHHFNERCEAHTNSCSPELVNCNGIPVNENFLPWHREFLENLENYLMANGGSQFVPLPAWDPCTAIPAEFQGSGSRCSNIAPISIGSNPDCPNPCTGFDSDKYSCENLCDFSGFCDFSIQLELDHNNVHCYTGGSMGSVATAAGNTIFYLWHAYVDEVWYNYQVANMDGDLVFEIEEVSVDPCGVNHYRVPVVNCLSDVEWTVDGVDVNIITQSQANGFFNLIFEFQDGGSCSFSIKAVLTSSCFETQSLGLDAKKPPCADAVLTDSEGNPTTSVCFGEDIFLDASNSMNYIEYFVSIWEKDAQGNTLNYARFDNPKWRSGTVPSPFNLSADIANSTWAYTSAPPSEWAFCPGGNYKVQFAVRNWCDTWEAVEIPFSVENCSTPVIEVVEENCGSTTVRVEFSENWVTGGSLFTANFPGVVYNQYYQDGYYYADVSSSQDGLVSISFNVKTPCDEINLSSSVYVCVGPPALSPHPPIDLANICFGEPNGTYCYDFESTPCVTGIMTGPPDPKLTVDINGSEICIGTNTDIPFTAVLYVWPVGPCGNGGIQAWVIRVNDPEFCDKQEPPRFSISNNNGETEESESRPSAVNNIDSGFVNNKPETGDLKIYPNPFRDVLNIKGVSMDSKNGLSIKIFNATGKLLIESDQMDQSVNTSLLAPGIYFVTILDKSGQIVHSEKLIKGN